ncbi:MAG: NCS2 family permease [Mycoplasmoidaceae bacterium]
MYFFISKKKGFTLNNVQNNNQQNRIKDYFQFDKRGAILSKEIIGGLSTFFAMMYILIVNPAILSGAIDMENGSQWMGALFLGTAIASFIATMLMGLFAKVPIAAAPGMGINAFLTYTVCLSFQLSFGEALVAVFVSGIFYFIIGITPLRRAIVQSVPKNFKIAISSMIGLFIAYIGLVNSKIIVVGNPAVPTGFGDFSQPLMVIALVLMILGLILHFCKIKFAILWIVIIGLIAVLITGAVDPTIGNVIFKLNDFNDFNKFGELSADMWSSFGTAFSKPLFYIAIFTFLYVDFFDTTATLTSLHNSKYFKEINKITENDKWNWFDKANIVDSCATTFGSVLLTSSVTTFVESNAGVISGAKTGIASIVTSLCFLLAIPLFPIIAPIMPINDFQPISGPILVLVGAMIMSQLEDFDWKSSLDIPVLILTLLIGMLSYSISKGISYATVVYILIYSLKGFLGYFKSLRVMKTGQEVVDGQLRFKDYFKDINWIIMGIGVISIVYIIIDGLIGAGVITP